MVGHNLWPNLWLMFENYDRIFSLISISCDKKLWPIYIRSQFVTDFWKLWSNFFVDRFQLTSPNWDAFVTKNSVRNILWPTLVGRNSVMAVFCDQVLPSKTRSKIFVINFFCHKIGRKIFLTECQSITKIGHNLWRIGRKTNFGQWFYDWRISIKKLVPNLNLVAIYLKIDRKFGHKI